MTLRLWLIMMLLVIFTVGFMWTVQVVVLERSHITSEEKEVDDGLASVKERLESEDLQGSDLLAYLGMKVGEKLVISGSDGELIALYSNGHPADMAQEPEENFVWWMLQNSEYYDDILARRPFSREEKYKGRVYAYEAGVPVTYGGKEAYLIVIRSFGTLYNIIDINRRHLIILSVLLTLASALLAALLARRFVKPIKKIKASVDELAKGNLIDVPELKMNDELGRLSRSVKELGVNLRKVDKLRKEVIANVSHELRSPLALIGGYAEMVRDIDWKDEKKRSEDLNLIVSESKRMSEMVSDILDYSQLQAGYLKLNCDRYDLLDIAEVEIGRCGAEAARHEITIKLNTELNELTVYADAAKLCQVIRNLLYNAINHTESGGEIEVKISADEKGVLFEVKNPGEPIPEDERAIIWERYQRSQHQGGRSAGTGIGLSIVSTILEAHGATYGVDCDGGITDFWFRLDSEN